TRVRSAYYARVYLHSPAEAEPPEYRPEGLRNEGARREPRPQRSLVAQPRQLAFGVAAGVLAWGLGRRPARRRAVAARRPPPSSPVFPAGGHARSARGPLRARPERAWRRGGRHSGRKALRGPVRPRPRPSRPQPAALRSWLASRSRRHRLLRTPQRP